MARCLSIGALPHYSRCHLEHVLRRLKCTAIFTLLSYPPPVALPQLPRAANPPGLLHGRRRQRPGARLL